jgi:pimeloyl-ACP methyl ester carboxylesterase
MDAKIFPLDFANTTEHSEGLALFVLGVSSRPLASNLNRTISGSGVSLNNFDAFGFNYLGQLIQYDFNRCVQNTWSAITQIRQKTTQRLTVIAFGTGGHIAMTAIVRYNLSVQNLVLVGPSVWPYSATSKNALITDPNLFHETLKNSRHWQRSIAFEDAKRLTTKTLIVRYSDDTPRRRRMAIKFKSVIPDSIVLKFPGTHNNMLNSPDRLSQLLELISPYVLSPDDE